MDEITPEPPETPPTPPPGFPPGLTVVCLTCDGDGWRYAGRAALLGGRIAAVGKQEACLLCSAMGRHSWRTGPGVEVRRHERAALPGYF